MRTFACTVLVATAAHVATASIVPRDFELNAKFFPGGGFGPGGPEPWRLTIAADGKAIVETNTYSGGKEQRHLKTKQLSQADLAQIVTTFQKASFFCAT